MIVLIKYKQQFRIDLFLSANVYSYYDHFDKLCIETKISQHRMNELLFNSVRHFTEVLLQNE